MGPLPPDFLRISTATVSDQEAADHQAALALDQYQRAYLGYHHQLQYMAPKIVGHLSITVAQAKLVKNYGLTRMDPYVRVRIGHAGYETQTATKGGKTPTWNHVIHCQLPVGVSTIKLQVYDECSFTVDELVAWADIEIPEVVLRGEMHEDWYPLSGRQGDGMEGAIDLVMSFVQVVPGTTPSPLVLPPAGSALPRASSVRPLPVYIQSPQPAMQAVHQPMQQPPPPQQPQQLPPVAQFCEADLKQINEMFPNMDKDVIKSVYEVNRFDKDATINSLLQLSGDDQ